MSCADNIFIQNVENFSFKIAAEKSEKVFSLLDNWA